MIVHGGSGESLPRDNCWTLMMKDGSLWMIFIAYDHLLSCVCFGII